MGEPHEALIQLFVIFRWWTVDCKSNNCTNDVEWVDDPEDYCKECVKKLEHDYDKFIDSEERED